MIRRMPLLYALGLTLVGCGAPDKPIECGSNNRYGVRTHYIVNNLGPGRDVYSAFSSEKKGPEEAGTLDYFCNRDGACTAIVDNPSSSDLRIKEGDEVVSRDSDRAIVLQSAFDEVRKHCTPK